MTSGGGLGLVLQNTTNTYVDGNVAPSVANVVAPLVFHDNGTSTLSVMQCILAFLILEVCVMFLCVLADRLPSTVSDFLLNSSPRLADR